MGFGGLGAALRCCAVGVPLSSGAAGAARDTEDARACGLRRVDGGAADLVLRQPREPRDGERLGFGRIVASELEAPIMLGNSV